MINAPAYGIGGGFMPSQHFTPQQPVDHPPFAYCAPTVWQAINALTPSLFRAATEQRTIYGSTNEAILANLLAKVSFAAASNFRIRGHNGNAMSLALHIRFAGRTLSGKTDTHDRLVAPIVEAMKGWKPRWLFNNTTPAALQRKLRAGSVLALLSMAEGRGHLEQALSRAFHELNELHDGNLPGFDRADDEEALFNVPDSVVFVSCVNAQGDANRAWLDKYGADAIGSGYLFRLMMLQSEETAVEGARGLQPEVALLDYDQRMVELIADGRIKLRRMPANRLPVIDVMPEAEQLLKSALDRFMWMASPVLSPDDARVFAVRLSANTRRIAGGMHTYEGYKDAVSADTMARAVTIAECFATHWLATVFPPKPLAESMRLGQRLLYELCALARSTGERSWREADVVSQAPNFGWSKAQMKEAIKSICGAGFAEVVVRTEKGRRVIKLGLLVSPGQSQPPGQTYLSGRF